MKTEMYRMYDINDKESLIEAISNYIHFYNYQRYQSSFDSKTPMEVRIDAFNNEKPKQYPIVFNPRIAKYKESLKNKPQSA
ncbi:IS3 family transposase [Thomasclavelia spiroformis]|uniref:IS3 family transposase n=1 Tax=Thomasclavelia spiroformis TaxID=29348 RepID=UPI001CD361D7|nr:IS3 family transposase [Thomasclavelia spiroformis]